MTDVISNALEQMTDYIAKARQAVTERRYMQVNDLLAQVEVVCQAVLALPKEEGAFFIEALDELENNLGLLQQEMLAAKEDLSRESVQLNMNQKAARSYRASQGHTTKPIAEE